MKKKKAPSPRLPTASLSVWFFFLSLGKLYILRDEKLPLYDGDGHVGKQDEPGDRVHPPVEHVRHGDERGGRQMHRRVQRQRWRDRRVGCEVSARCQDSKAVGVSARLL